MNFDWLSGCAVGMVKACMRSAFAKSKDAHIQIIRKPELRVIVLKAFKKAVSSSWVWRRMLS